MQETDPPRPPISTPAGEQVDEELERRAGRLLARAYELAVSPLEGIDEAAVELGEMAGDDRRVVERARRLLAERLSREPVTVDKQVASLVRRAIELCDRRWRWEDTGPVP